MKTDNDMKMDNKDDTDPDKKSVENSPTLTEHTRWTIHGDTSDDDSDDNSIVKPKSAVDRRGPSLARIAAQQMITASKLTTPQTERGKDLDQQSSSGSSRSQCRQYSKQD